MAKFKQYTKKDGTKWWMFMAYLGLDPTTGKQVNTTKRNFATKREATASYDRLKVQFQSGELFEAKDSKATKFRAVFDMWKENYEYTVKESTFVKTVQQYEVHILSVFGDKYIDKITVAELQKFANKKVKTYKKYRDLINDISRIYEYAIKMELIKDNPIKRITIPRRKEDVGIEKRRNYYTKEELQQFLTLCQEQQPHYVFTFFQLLSASGCRQGELLGLEWRNVDFENKCIHIVQTLARGKNDRLYMEQPKTKHSKRTVSLDDYTLSILKQWQSGQKERLVKLGHKSKREHQLVFANEENECYQLSKPRAWMLQNIRKNDLYEITIHGFRHTHATLLLEAGVAPKVISERLGHASIQITLNLYAHVTEKMETAVPNIFATVMGTNSNLQQSLQQSTKKEPANAVTLDRSTFTRL